MRLRLTEALRRCSVLGPPLHFEPIKPPVVRGRSPSKDTTASNENNTPTKARSHMQEGTHSKKLFSDAKILADLIKGGSSLFDESATCICKINIANFRSSSASEQKIDQQPFNGPAIDEKTNNLYLLRNISALLCKKNCKFDPSLKSSSCLQTPLPTSPPILHSLLDLNPTSLSIPEVYPLVKLIGRILEASSKLLEAAGGFFIDGRPAAKGSPVSFPHTSTCNVRFATARLCFDERTACLLLLFGSCSLLNIVHQSPMASCRAAAESYVASIPFPFPTFPQKYITYRTPRHLATPADTSRSKPLQKESQNPSGIRVC
ncbi:hypothetical protein DL98DRAFT_618349 [Cadophora sp. DSE1049]|nr:hypothetical protein DL98DRAFT_618349 [Cadophora sp. DSE1049]